MEPERWSAIEKLYHAAMEQVPAERLAFLQGTCADEDLRREVESLLKHQQSGDELLENPQWHLRLQDSRPALSTGERLGPYEILGRVGAGGMGEVYRALDPRLGREVAIKVLPEHLARDPQAVARFEREARAVAALSHPNILAIFDVGSDQGKTYSVTELLEGDP